MGLREEFLAKFARLKAEAAARQAAMAAGREAKVLSDEEVARGHPKVKMNGRTVEGAAWWHFVLLALFYVPFFLVGFGLTIARYRLTLTDDLVAFRFRILPYVGWTSTLPAGEAVKVSLAYRGASRNKKPVDSVVVASQGKEIHFGAFLEPDVKEHLAGLIRHYYGDAPAAAPFLAPPESGR